jgi:hypothetical protein
VQAQLQPYERLFGPEKQHYSLDQVRWSNGIYPPVYHITGGARELTSMYSSASASLLCLPWGSVVSAFKQAMN